MLSLEKVPREAVLGRPRPAAPAAAPGRQVGTCAGSERNHVSSSFVSEKTDVFKGKETWISEVLYSYFIENVMLLEFGCFGKATEGR